MKISHKKIAISLLLAVTIILSSFAAINFFTSAQIPIPVDLTPPALGVNLGDSFAIDVFVIDTYSEPLDAFDFIVNYNSAYMTAVNVIPGPMVPAGDLALFTFDLSTLGVVHFWDLGPNGVLLLGTSGVLATIEFVCTEVGYSTVSINTASVFLDPAGTVFPVAPSPGLADVDQVYPPAHTYVEPPSYTVPISTPFTVDVNVQDVTNLYLYQLALSYDTLYVDAVDIVPGGFFPSPLVLNKVIDDAAGTILFDVQETGGSGISGSGTLATITFHCTGAGESILTIDSVAYFDPAGIAIPSTTADGRVIQFTYWEPIKLQHIVEWPGTIAYVDLLGYVPDPLLPGYTEIRSEFEAKGYNFVPTEIVALQLHGVEPITVGMTREPETFSGVVTSHWSTNTLEDGTRANLMTAQMDDGTSMAMGFITNVLPPEQVPGVDPYIIWNAEPYFYIEFYWWAWTPIGRIIRWPYWWHNSHNHPNWFWGPYWWWRTYTKAYYLGYWPPTDINWVYWRPWWGWWWHWVYWRHWYWWSSYFPYDP